MTTHGSVLFDNAELALAAYANLNRTDPVSDQKEALKEAGMTEIQGIQFAARYPTVVAVIPDTEYGFSGTVFRDASGQLTVALRGTAGAGDLLQDVGLTIHGAAYNQIVDMVNWWQKETAANGQAIYEYKIEWSSTEPTGSVLKMEGNREGPGAHPQTEFQWLVRTEVIANRQGALYGASDLNAVNVTGHSLGGHLASAFTALFSSQVDQAFTYNGPGFKNTDANKAFFAMLEGVAPANVTMPSDVAGKVIRVQANDATPGEGQIEAISNLHGGTPGTLVQVAIEDRGFWAGDIGTGNHSIVNLTDSLTLYGLLGKLDPALDIETFNRIFHGASNSMDNTREAILDSLQLLITGDSTPLPAGEDFRNDFYVALYVLQTHPLFASPDGVFVKSSKDINSIRASMEFSAFLSLYHLSPVYLAGAELDNLANENIYADWSAGLYGPEYLSDRMTMLHTLLQNNSSDKKATSASDRDVIYYDYETGQEVFFGGGNDSINVSNDTHNIQVHFGSHNNDIIEGGEKNDYFYGGKGHDTYVFDMNNNENGIGMDTIIDSDGGTLLLQDISLGTLRPIGEDANIYKDDSNANISIILNGDTLQIIRSGTADIITLKGFNKEGALAERFGLNFEVAQVPESPDFSDLYSVDSGLLGRYEPDEGDAFNVYLPASRSIKNNPDYVAQEEDLDWEKYRNIAMHYAAGIYTASGGIFQGSNLGDVLEGTAMANNLKGQDGNDYLYGDSNNPADVSTGVADTLIGGRGNDTLYGGGGNDTLYGSDQYTPASTAISDAGYRNFLGWNFTSGTLGQSVKAGTSTIETVNEKNYLHGGDGNDNLYGASYQDMIIGGTGDDRIYAGAGQDKIGGGDNNDQIWGDSYWLQGNGASALADFIAPDKTPGATDYKRSYFYQDGHNLATSLDPLVDYNDIIDAGEGNDWVMGEIGHDVINGGGGADDLYGDRPFNTGMFGIGFNVARQQLSHTYHGNDVINGGDGDDNIIGGGGDDVLFGGDESILSSWDGVATANLHDNGNMNDRIYGDLGIGYYDYAKSGTSETIETASQSEWSGTDVIFGGKGNDFLVGEGGNDQLYGGDDNDVLVGDWNTTTQSSITQAQIDLYGGADELYGGTGIDLIFGGGGDDILVGGIDDDRLYGDAGNDTYLYRGGVSINTTGDGADTITDTLGQNILKLMDIYLIDGKVFVDQDATDIRLKTSFANISVEMSQDTFKTFIGRVQDGNGNTLTLQKRQNMGSNVTSELHLLTGLDYVADSVGDINASLKTLNNVSELSFNEYHRVDVVFDGSKAELTLHKNNGETVNLSVTNWAGFANLLDAASNIAGYKIDISHNTQDGLIVYGKGGSDIIMGGAANEVLNGQGGSDTVSYASASSAVSVSLTTTAAQNTGGGGADTLISIENLTGSHHNDTLTGNSGSNVLTGGLGNDILDGSTGADTFVFNKGDGSDTITNSDNSDVIQINADPANVYITRDGDDYLIKYKDSSADSIRIIGTTGVDRIYFLSADTTWILDSSINLGPDRIHTISLSASESAGVDDVSVLFHPDILLKNDGDLLEESWHVIDVRVLSGIDDPEQFYYGEFLGSNTIMAFRVQAVGSATLQYFVQQESGGPIYAQTINVNFDDLSGGLMEGTDENDVLDAMDAALTVMDGKNGDDVIIGGMGADTVLHRIGDGNDVLQMYEGGGIHDQLILMGDGTLTPADVWFQQDAYSLKIHVGAEIITVDDFFHDSNVWGPIWTRYGELGSIKFFSDDRAYQNWLSDPSAHPPTAEWTLADLLENERELAVDYRELWLQSPGEGLVAGGENADGQVSYSALWAESPDSEAEPGESWLSGREEESAFFFDNSRAYP